LLRLLRSSPKPSGPTRIPIREHPKVKATNSNRAPIEIRVIAALFALCGIYLASAGLVMLVRPGVIGMTAGAPLLFGLELAGPWMFLLIGAAGLAVAFGVMRLNNFARHAALLIAIAGIVMLVAPVSAAAVAVEPKALAVGGFGIIMRVIVAWNLGRSEVAKLFRRTR
jgi:hypothetical protein